MKKAGDYYLKAKATSLAKKIVFQIAGKGDLPSAIFLLQKIEGKISAKMLDELFRASIIETSRNVKLAIGEYLTQHDCEIPFWL